MLPDPLQHLDGAERKKLRRRKPAKSPGVMLATLTKERFSSPDWLYERKVDGVRCLVSCRNGKVTLTSRNGKSQDRTFPELVEEAADLCRWALIADGEIVAFEGDVTSFSRLQKRLGIQDSDRARHTGVKVYLYLFDILNLDGYDLRRLPLRRRKAILRRALDFGDPVRYMQHRNQSGEKYLDDACKRGWEGVIAKRADSPYTSGRSRDWLKFKCGNQQELVIVGFTDPEGSRKGFGALLVGYYEHGSLRYAGRVGTGFDDELLGKLRKRMDGLARDSSPLDDVGEDGVHWIRPALVAEIGFTEWTSSGKLRHPRFLGLRHDKSAKDVVREKPM